MGCNLTIWHPLLWLFKETTGCFKRQPTVEDVSWPFTISMILILQLKPLSLWPLDIQLQWKKQFLSVFTGLGFLLFFVACFLYRLFSKTFNLFRISSVFYALNISAPKYIVCHPLVHDIHVNFRLSCYLCVRLIFWYMFYIYDMYE